MKLNQHIFLGISINKAIDRVPSMDDIGSALREEILNANVSMFNKLLDLMLLENLYQ